MSNKLTPYIVSLAVILPPILVWRNINFYYVGWFYVALAAIVMWLWWQPGERINKVVWPWIALVIFWFSSWPMFLLLSHDLYRVIFLILQLVITWWYLSSWLTNQSHILGLIKGAGLIPTSAVCWLVFFFLGATATAWLVLLGTKLWLIIIFYLLALLFLIGALWWTAGWNFWQHWPYALVLGLVQLEIFIVTLWLPTSFYLIGWLQASSFLLLFLLIWHEASLAISRRQLIRYLILLFMATVVLIWSARWF